MWIFTTDGFYSIVLQPNQHTFTVRSRVKGDLEKLFPKKLHKHIRRTPISDYLYRIDVLKATFQDAMLKAMAKITYPNFKSAVNDPARHFDYVRVWSAMAEMQDSFDNAGKKKMPKYNLDMYRDRRFDEL